MGQKGRFCSDHDPIRLIQANEAAGGGEETKRASDLMAIVVSRKEDEGGGGGGGEERMEDEGNDGMVMGTGGGGVAVVGTNEAARLTSKLRAEVKRPICALICHPQAPLLVSAPGGQV